MPDTSIQPFQTVLGCLWAASTLSVADVRAAAAARSLGQPRETVEGNFRVVHITVLLGVGLI